MRNKFRLFVLFISVLFFIVGCGSGEATEPDEEVGSAEEVTEEVAEETKEESDERIIATTVAITEIMEELDLDLVGVPTSYKGLPERYADATEVGNPMGPDMEIVMSLQPTNVISVTNLQDDLGSVFESSGVPGSFLDFDSVDSMFNEIIQLGEQYDRVAEAEQLVAKFENKMTEIEEQVSNLESPKVLILMGIPGSYIVGTENSYIADLVSRAGGVSAVTGYEEDYISANTEYLQQTDPDIILRAVHGAPAEVVKMFDMEFSENDIWKHFDAVKEGRVYDLEETLFGTTANLAVDEALEELITILYPEN